MDAADGIWVGAPHGDARDAHAKLCPAVKTVAQRDDLPIPRADGSEEQGTLRRLRARRAEECFLQVAGRDGGELFCEIDEVLGQVDVADVLERADLRLNLFRDFGIAVTAVHDGYACEAVEVFPAFTVEKVLHRAADNLARLFVEMPETRHDVLLFLFENGFGSDVMLFFHIHSQLKPFF